MESVRLILPRVPEHVTRVRPCSCGGTVRADVRFPYAGVAAHQRTKRHLAWRAEREREQ